MVYSVAIFGEYRDPLQGRLFTAFRITSLEGWEIRSNFMRIDWRSLSYACRRAERTRQRHKPISAAANPNTTISAA